MATLNKIIKITQADYDLILEAYPDPVPISTGETITYDPNSIYLVPHVTEITQLIDLR